MGQPVVVISYSHKDESEKEQLLSHLRVLQQAGLIKAWSDDRIAAGADWKKEISQALAQAKVVILLISANFLASELVKTEIPNLLKRRHQDGLIVLPVIARACAWQSTPWLRQMNVRPPDGRPVWRDGGRQVDEELAAIVEEVAQILQKISPEATPENSGGGEIKIKRRVDAAAPRYAQLGRSIDLLLQVRFPDSPPLGIKDWPLRQRPPGLEQNSEPVPIQFPSEPETGKASSGHLEIRVVAPDFVIEGKGRQRLEVPPDRYSRRVLFLLTPQQEGPGRINLEISGPGQLYLGVIPLEVVVGRDGSGPTASVAHLLLAVTPEAQGAGSSIPAAGTPDQAQELPPDRSQTLRHISSQVVHQLVNQAGYRFLAEEDFAQKVFARAGEAWPQDQKPPDPDTIIRRITQIAKNEYALALYAGCRSPNPAELNRAYQELGYYLYRIAYHYVKNRFCPAVLAEECVQEALIQIHKHIASVKRPGGFLKFAITTTRHICLKVVKKAVKHGQCDETPGEEIMIGIPSETVDKDLLECLLQAIERLPNKDWRVLLVLEHFAGFPNDEIARILNTTKNNVYTMRHKARKHLRNDQALKDCLSGQGSQDE